MKRTKMNEVFGMAASAILFVVIVAIMFVLA